MNEPLQILWHWNPATDALRFSANACRLFKCSQAQLPETSREFLDGLAPPDRARLTHALTAARDSGHEFVISLGWSGGLDSVAVRLLVTGIAMTVDRATVLHGSICPPSAPMDAAGDLRRRLATLLYEHGDDGIVLVDADGRCLEANPAVERLLAMPRHELIGSRLLRSLGSDSSNAEAESGAAIPLRGLRQLTKSDGTQTTLEYECIAAMDNGVGAFALRDVSQRLHTEKLQALLAAIVESSDDAIISKDLDGIIRSWNASAERLFGYTADEAVGRHITLLIPQAFRREEDAILAQIRRGERVEHYQTVRVAKDGRLLDISLSVSPIFDASGQVIGASKIARDVSVQHQAELALRNSRELLDTVISAAPVAVAIMDANGVVNYWNGAAERIFGWSAEEIFSSAAPTQDSARVQLLHTLRRSTPGDSVEGVETTIVRKNGIRLEIAIWSTNLRTAPHETPRKLIIAADVSEQRRTQRALRDQEQRMRAALNASRTGTFRWEMSANRLDGDQNLDRLFGLVPGGTITSVDRFIDLVHPEDQSAVRDGLRRCATEGTDFEMDMRVIWPDASLRWLYAIGQTGRDELGRPQYMTGACVDITHRKESEQALREGAERFRTLADNIAQFAWMADGQGSIFWYNRRWFDYTGTNLEQMQGWGWRDVHHPDHVERVVQKITRHFATGEVWEDTFPLRAADGSYRWFLSRATPIRNNEGEVTRWFGTNTDITELRNMEEALRESDRRKDAFLATLSHELRNPLAPILNSLELLRMTPGDAKMALRLHETMDRQAGYLVRLVDDLLEVSRISRNKVQLRLEPVTLADVVDSALETVQQMVEKRQHTITVELPKRPVRLYADPARLTQIFSNLLSNSVRYTDPGGRIKLRAGSEDAVLTVQIRDTGCGIEPHMLERVFEMFVQTSPMESGRSGLGIGLTLVKSLVELHGGTISAFSAGLGAGSEFVVSLPIIETSQVPPPTTTQDGMDMSASAQHRILVVDDNEDAAVSTTMLLEAMGNEVRTAYDGAEALGIAADFRPQVVLLDLGMPKLNGYETARRLRQEPWGQEMVLIALTGWGQEQDRQRTTDAGFDHHLVKPVDPSALRNLLSEIAESRA